MAFVKTHWVPFLRSIFVATGALWLPLEAYEGLTNSDVNLQFAHFAGFVVALGVTFFLVDGNYLAGYLKRSITIQSNSFDSKVIVKFGDLFKMNGWKAIGVNDFFDNVVDEDLVSSNSLHGHVLNAYWKNDSKDWQRQIDQSLRGAKSKKTQREKGNTRRYPIGTTATAKANSQRFLFVALGRTNHMDNVVSASTESLIRAIRGMLGRARIVCSNEALHIPLMGSGLARVGIKNAILVDLILAAIFEETKLSKVTDSITIVLPEEKSSEINLGAIGRDWR